MLSVGISSSVAVFLLLTSICLILSLSSIDDVRKTDVASIASAEQTKVFRIPKYFPNFAMFFVMSIGIIAMVIFLIIKQDRLTATNGEENMTRHHYLHRKYSLRSIIFFFGLGSILHVNYLAVEFSCLDKWTHCDHNGTSVFGVNLSEVMFHMCCIVFAFFETIICWVMRHRNFIPSQWVWHALAVIQAANLAIWFDSLLKEAYLRINENSGSFDWYFSLCNTTSNNHSHPETSIAAKWFLGSSPFLFPVTIEFALLVIETLLGRITAEKDHNPEAAPAGHVGHNLNLAANDGEAMPLLPRENQNQNRPILPPQYTNSRWSKIFKLVSVIFNIVYFVLTILVFVGYKSSDPGIDDQLQVYDDIFTIYSVFYDVFSIICCVVGIVSCLKFQRPQSHTSFLEYLLLLATCGVCLQSIKRIVAFVKNGDESLLGFYVTCGVLDVCQSLLQIVFYYFAKDVKLQPFEGNGQVDSPSSVAVFKASLFVVSVNNFFIWVNDSLFLPETLPGITPSHYVIEQWPVFDNAVTPITIFFRFNSVLLFSCIGTDIFREGELHRE